MCGNHLLALIDDVLDLPCMKISALELLPQTVQLPRLLDSVADLFRVKVKEKQLQFVLQTEGPADE